MYRPFKMLSPLSIIAGNYVKDPMGTDGFRVRVRENEAKGLTVLLEMHPGGAGEPAACGRNADRGPTCWLLACAWMRRMNGSTDARIGMTE